MSLEPPKAFSGDVNGGSNTSSSKGVTGCKEEMVNLGLPLNILNSHIIFDLAKLQYFTNLNLTLDRYLDV